MAQQTDTLLDVVRAYWDAGLCPMPRVVGHVEPSFIDDNGEAQVIAWGEFKSKQADWGTVERWFAHSDPATVGMILLTGSSAHPRAERAAFLQILDIESAACFEAFQEELNFTGHADILHRCVIEHRRDRQDDMPIDHPRVEHGTHLTDPVIHRDLRAAQAQGGFTAHRHEMLALTTVEAAIFDRPHLVRIATR